MALNAHGRAGSGADRRPSRRGPTPRCRCTTDIRTTVTVPGCVDGWLRCTSASARIADGRSDGAGGIALPSRRTASPQPLARGEPAPPRGAGAPPAGEIAAVRMWGHGSCGPASRCPALDGDGGRAAFYEGARRRHDRVGKGSVTRDDWHAEGRLASRRSARPRSASTSNTTPAQLAGNLTLAAPASPPGRHARRSRRSGVGARLIEARLRRLRSAHRPHDRAAGRQCRTRSRRGRHDATATRRRAHGRAIG